MSELKSRTFCLARLKLKASLTWNDIKQRLDREFDPDDVLRQDLYDALLRSHELVFAVFLMCVMTKLH